MHILVERKIFKIGEGGFAVTLPKAWINYHHLKQGDTIEVIIDNDLIIRIQSKQSKNEKKSSDT
jgi:antitoxin component of MazEF toxin-antitoxin module